MSPAVPVLVVAVVLLWPRPRSAVAGALAVPGTAPARRRSGQRGSSTADLESLAEVADLLAMALRSGATPVAAVRIVARRAPPQWQEVLTDVAIHLAAGGEAGEAWRRHARRHPVVGPLAGAWVLSEGLGVPLAPSMGTSAQVLRAQVRGRRRLDAATSGARATMRLLTLLPLLGIFAGTTFGLTPWEVYGHSTVTAASAVLGLVLTGVGWALCRWVLQRAAAPERHR